LLLGGLAEHINLKAVELPDKQRHRGGTFSSGSLVILILLFIPEVVRHVYHNGLRCCAQTLNMI